MGTVTDVLFLSSKITVDGDTAMKLKTKQTKKEKNHLLFERKAMINLASVLKSKDITLPTKILIVKAMFIPIVMNGYECWTIKKAEC